ncbi:MAG: hypothetical protein KA149_04355 [Chitinophagales bacterium]|nr:hypothetical protein [Chitinophagales bacterium]
MAESIKPETFLNNMLGEVIDQIVNGQKKLPPEQQQQLKDKVPFPDANFFTWCTPGIPVTPKDFEFLKGLRKPVDYEKFKDLTEEQKATMQGDEAYAMTVAMDNFSLLVNTVPNKSGLVNSLQVWEPQQQISNIYESVLMNCEVADTIPSPEAEERIKKIRAVTDGQTVERVNSDGVTITEERPSAMQAAYLTYLSAYLTAYNNYSDLMNKAATGNAADVQKASMLGPTYYKSVTAAYDQWVSAGHKTEYEKNIADLQQLEGVSMSLLLKSYREMFERSKRTSFLDSSTYNVSRLVPGSFYESNGWTNYSFSSSKLKNSSNSNKRDYSAGGMWGIIGGAKGSYSKLDTQSSISFDNFEMDFELTQVPIVRTWFREDFLISNKWRFKTQGGAGTQQLLSNGKADNAEGSLFAYPTVIIFARNIKITESVYDKINTEAKKTMGASGGFSLGPFSIGGKAGQKTIDKTIDVTRSGGKVIVPGMQIVGFRNHILPLSPNPDTAVTKWI